MSCKDTQPVQTWCIQCECPIPRRCAKCAADRTRKPRVVEVYNAPAILSVNACGCVEIRCQRAACGKRDVWRHPRADGTLGYKNHFCSPECVRAETAEARKKGRVTAECSCGCKRTVTRPPSNMRARYSYFSQRCHFRHRTKLAAQARREKARADLATLRGLLQCETCKDVTEHMTPQTRFAICLICGTKRTQSTKEMQRALPPRQLVQT